LWHEKKLSGLQELLPLLETVVQSGKPLLIVAEDVEGEALDGRGSRFLPRANRGPPEPRSFVPAF
jgi:hypothetical protein